MKRDEVNRVEQHARVQGTVHLLAMTKMFGKRCPNATSLPGNAGRLIENGKQDSKIWTKLPHHFKTIRDADHEQALTLTHGSNTCHSPGTSAHSCKELRGGGGGSVDVSSLNHWPNLGLQSHELMVFNGGLHPLAKTCSGFGALGDFDRAKTL